jgi:hypothetical protein
MTPLDAVVTPDKLARSITARTGPVTGRAHGVGSTVKSRRSRPGEQMPEAGKPMSPSRAVQRSAQAALAAGLVVSALYGVLGLLGHGTRMLPPVLIVVLALAGRPLAVLRGRTLLGTEEVMVRRPPFGRLVIPVPHIGLVAVRRGLVLEWPVLGLRDGSVVELAAPVRLWFRADAGFARDLAALGDHVRDRAVVSTRPQWSLLRLVTGPLVTATAVGLVLVDPPWASDAWPLRPHARSLPDACRMFDARARVLLPGAAVDRMFSGSDDSGPHVKRHTCQWNSTRLDSDGTTLVDVGRLSIEIELEHGVGRHSDAELAHREFVRETRVNTGEAEVRLPRLGDEAELINVRPGSAWVTVAVHKANVEEKIDLAYRDPAREREAAEAARGLARLGLSEIHFN